MTPASPTPTRHQDAIACRPSEAPVSAAPYAIRRLVGERLPALRRWPGMSFQEQAAASQPRTAQGNEASALPDLDTAASVAVKARHEKSTAVCEPITDDPTLTHATGSLPKDDRPCLQPSSGAKPTTTARSA